MASPRASATRSERTARYIGRTVTPKNYLEEYSCMPPPIFIPLITAIEIAIFLYYALSDANIKKINWFSDCAGCFDKEGAPGVFMFSPFNRAQAWRFLTYMLLHAGLSHLGGNVVMQLIVGVPLEMVHKFWRVAPLYLIGVIFGAMCQYIIDSKAYLVGASGGVYALIVAHLANVALNWSEMPLKWVRLLVFGLFVGLDFGSAIYRRYWLDECEAVSYAAHIGGAITGLLLGFVLLKNVHVLKWERILFWVSLVMYVFIFASAAVIVAIQNPGVQHFVCIPDTSSG